MSELSGIPTSAELMLSSEAILARRTVGPGNAVSGVWRRRLEVPFSKLLRLCALDLWFARILQPCEPTLPGLGGDFDRNWRALVTACCPSDSEPVALGLTTDGIACSCSASVPTPCARDWKDGTSVAHAVKHYKRNITEKRGPQFPRWVAFHHGFMPGPIVYEVALGFPEDWTAIESAPSEIRSSRRSRSGSRSGSKKRKVFEKGS